MTKVQSLLQILEDASTVQELVQKYNLVADGVFYRDINDYTIVAYNTGYDGKVQDRKEFGNVVTKQVYDQLLQNKIINVQQTKDFFSQETWSRIADDEVPLAAAHIVINQNGEIK